MEVFCPQYFSTWRRRPASVKAREPTEAPTHRVRSILVSPLFNSERSSYPIYCQPISGKQHQVWDTVGEVCWFLISDKRKREKDSVTIEYSLFRWFTSCGTAPPTQHLLYIESNETSLRLCTVQHSVYGESRERGFVTLWSTRAKVQSFVWPCDPSTSLVTSLNGWAWVQWRH